MRDGVRPWRGERAYRLSDPMRIELERIAVHAGDGRLSNRCDFRVVPALMARGMVASVHEPGSMRFGYVVTVRGLEVLGLA